MNIFKTTAAALMSSLLIGAASMAAWSAANNPTAPTAYPEVVRPTPWRRRCSSSVVWLPRLWLTRRLTRTRRTAKPGTSIHSMTWWATRKLASWAA
jgi:hypothetical protein